MSDSRAPDRFISEGLQTVADDRRKMMPYMDNNNAERFVRLYADMILRISCIYLKQRQDAEDICQDVFLKMMLLDTDFQSEEHEKAWIIRTTINACKDHLRKSWFRRNVPLDEAKEVSISDKSETDILEGLMKLPKHYRISMFLHYYEGYKVYEIASMLGKQPNTISAYLTRGKRKLKSMLSAEENGK